MKIRFTVEVFLWLDTFPWFDFHGHNKNISKWAIRFTFSIWLGKRLEWKGPFTVWLPKI